MNLDLSRITYYTAAHNGLSISSCKQLKRANDVDRVLKIGHETSKGINFGRKLLVTSSEPECETYDFDVEIVKGIDHLEYTRWISENLHQLIDTDFSLNFHSDGMIQNPSAWTDEFYNYDYIGAIFLRSFVGNGGFSLRSRLFAEVMSQIDMSIHCPQKENDVDNEDVLFCHTYRDFFEEKGVKYAPLQIASEFSTESIATNPDHFRESFGFHEIERLADPNIINYRRSYMQKILNEY